MIDENSENEGSACNALLSRGDFMCVSCIEFADTGSVSAQPLHVGDLQSCERVADMLPAISYSGDRPVKKAWMSIIRTQDWIDQLESSRVSS
jgi:hypothetical protein